MVVNLPSLPPKNGRWGEQWYPENSIIDMIDFCNKKQKEALILLVDFQKAFDSISHSFIDSTLKLYGFGDSIRKWVRLFFNKREATVMGGLEGAVAIALAPTIPAIVAL